MKRKNKTEQNIVFNNNWDELMSYLLWIYEYEYEYEYEYDSLFKKIKQLWKERKKNRNFSCKLFQRGAIKKKKKKKKKIKRNKKNEKKLIEMNCLDK